MGTSVARWLIESREASLTAVTLPTLAIRALGSNARQCPVPITLGIRGILVLAGSEAAIETSCRMKEMTLSNIRGVDICSSPAKNAVFIVVALVLDGSQCFVLKAPKILATAGQHQAPWGWFTTHHRKQCLLNQVLAPPDRSNAWSAKLSLRTR